MECPRVLVVDDSESNLVVLKFSLAHLGASADTACNGRLAVEHFLKSKYALIFMDLDMPVMTGFEATAAIRAHELDHGLAPIPIIAITAGDTTKESCLAAGMSDFAQKPILIDDVKKMLQTWAGFSSPPKE